MDQGRPGRRKKIVVAIARQLAVDLWRLPTGRATAAQLGLVVGYILWSGGGARRGAWVAPQQLPVSYY